MADTEQQQQYLHDGWMGTGIEQVDDQWVVRFEKMIFDKRNTLLYDICKVGVLLVRIINCI